jgi:type 2 lantibiotic biosynthesis protein LanM
VLARLLAQASTFAVDACLELLSRFAADRAAIVAELLGGVDPGQVVAIEARGDKHRHGRVVAILAFADARRVVYQPRDVEPYVRFAALVRWLNGTVPELALRAVTAMRRSGYGWAEFVDGRPLADLAGADRFYRRQGALLALLHAVHGTDVHYENLVACADQPVLVDVETLFHPSTSRPRGPVDPAARALAGSVHRTALLPMIIVGEHGAVDMSGLGGDRGTVLPESVVDWEFPATDQMRLARGPRTFRGGLNRPRLDDHELDPGDHKPALLDGFRLGYDAIVRHRTEFTSLIEGCAELETRVVVRQTRVYANLLDESTHPDLLRDGEDRDRALDVLVAGASDLPGFGKLLEHERADLWVGDVPLFTGRPGSRDVWTSTGRRLPGLLDRTGLSGALDTVAAMDEMDRRDQEWIISATLATRGSAGGHGAAAPFADPMTGIAAHPERLLATACAVADQIVARSMVGGDRLNWLGLELVDDRQWLVLPMGAGLANGYVGVALFLAQLARLSGIERYGEVARRAVGAVPPLFEILAAQPALAPVIGPGGLHGLGGIGYALARMSTLLQDNDLRRWAGIAVGHAASSRTSELGWATGDAGCLAATTAIHAELGLDSAARLARACAERLLETSAELPSGFADGAAGIGWALANHGETDAARAVLCRLAADRPEHGWCTGTAGVAVARTWLTDDEVRASLARAVRVLSDRPVLRDLSLCHGELGIADVLTTLAPHVPDAAAARRRRAGLVLDALDRYGPCCGTPDGVPTPGLLTGLAGIGYGLLRIGFPERVPSVLLLQPTPGS